MRSFPPRSIGIRLAVIAAGAVAFAASVTPPPVFAQDPEAAAEGVPPGSDSSETATDTEIADAVTEAAETNEDVEIPSLGSASSEVFAAPDGTFIENIALEPFQALTGDGVWAPIDNTLVATGDGTLAPANNDIGIAFSGGGTTQLAKLTDLHGRSVAYTWHEALPVPTVSADTAVYAEVLPGVDLKVRATNTGFAKVFEVKTAAAAASAEVASLELGVELDGFDAAVGATGALEISDYEGNVVFGGPTPVMWDATAADAGVGDAEDPSWSPSSFSLSATVGTTYADGVLTLAPDAAMLADPAAVYPIRIDPEVVKLDSSAWAMISDYSSYRNRSYYNGGSFEKDPNGTARLGRAHKADGSMEQTWRLAFEFNTGKFRGKDIIDANLRMTMTYSWMHQCDGISATADIHELDAGSLKNWTWNDQGSWGSKIASRDEGIGSGCGAPRELWTDVTDYVQEVADSSDKKIQFGLRSSSESCGSQCPSFRRFGPERVKDGHTGFYLSVKYNTAPNAPSAFTIDGQSCTSGKTVKLGAAVSWTVTAKLTDDEGDNMDAVLTWKDQVSGTTKAWPTSGADREKATWTVHESSVPGQKYTATVSAKDSRATGESAGGCTVLVDTTPPEPPTVTSTDYPSDGEFHGSVGQTGRFTVDSTSADTAGYCWGLQGECEEWVPAPTLGGPATFALDPPTDGDLSLYVRAYDEHGNNSDATQYDFMVDTASSPVAHWKFDETSGTTAADEDYDYSGDVNRPLTVTGATWTAGDSEDAANGRNRFLSFDGNDQAETASPVVATHSSYTVSAWVRIHETDVDYTIASQEGFVNSAFMLKYDGESHTFLMVASNQDSTASGLRAVSAGSNITAEAGVWYNVTGVFSYGDQQLRLYVNGQLENTAPFTEEWNATGSFVVGRDLWGGRETTHFAGDVDEVHVWNRVVSTGEIQRIGQHADAIWDFETVNDDRIQNQTSGRHTLTGTDLGLVEGFQGTAAEFNGTTSTAVTSGPVLNTAADFTIGAWVRLDRDDITVNVVSQDGVYSSPFYLGYVAGATVGEDGETVEGRWAFRATSKDAASGYTWTELYATAEVATGDWTHLAVVYETTIDPDTGAPIKAATLYVNGIAQGTSTAFNLWSATGPMRIGSVKHRGEVSNYWPGAIDNVSVNTGGFDFQQISAMADRTVRENHSELVTGDFNGDGHLDALAIVDTENGDSDVRMMRGDGQGGFALMTDAEGNPLTVMRSDMLPQRDGERDWRLQDATWRAGDINGDTVDDLVVAVPGEDQFRVWGLPSCNPRTDGTCTQDVSPFKPTGTAPIVLTRGDGWELSDTEIQVGDLSGDMHDDLVLLRGEGTSAYSIWTAPFGASGRKVKFTDPTELAAGTGDPRFIDFAVADFNGDFRGDLVEIRTGADGSADMYTRYGIADGLGEPEFELDTPNNWDTERDRVTVADVTGDGLPDLVASYRFTQRIRLQVAAALPEGGFDTAKAWSYSTNCTGCATDLTEWTHSDIQAGDTDGDGDADLVSLRAETGGGIGALWTRYSTGAAFSSEPTPMWADATTCFGTEGDVNGDGFRDAVLPYSTYAAEGLPHAGAVWFIDGATGAASLITEETHGAVGDSEEGDQFGHAVGLYDADGDGCSEIAIGVPGENNNRGSVIVLPGSPGGIDDDAAYWFSQASKGIPGAAEDDDRFGYSVAAANRNDGVPVLVVGAPGEDVQIDTTGAYRDGDTEIAEIVGGGAVVYIQGDTKAWLTQNSWGSTSAVEAGDQFGFSVAATARRFIVGFPYEDSSVSNSGGVLILNHDTDAAGVPGTVDWIDQTDTFMAGGVESSDALGQAVAAVDYWPSGTGADVGRTKFAIGIPGEDIVSNTVANGGMVSLIDLDSAGAFTLTLNFTQSNAFGETPTVNDYLGSTLGLYNLAPNKYGSNATVMLAVGVPREDYATADTDGIVHITGAIAFPGGTSTRCDTIVYAPTTTIDGAFGTNLAATSSRLYITEPGTGGLHRFAWSEATAGTDKRATAMITG